MAGTHGDLEQALRRVVALGGTDDASSGVLAGSRRAILDILRLADEPLTAVQVAQLAGVHLNTTRHHLEVLAAADLVSRATESPTGRGRPKALYAASASAQEPFLELEQLIERALSTSTTDQVAVETARRWARSVPPVRRARDLDEAIVFAVEALRSAGFQAQSDAIGDTITVTRCPYASLIAEHPMICTIHAELVANVLEQTGQPVTVAGFDVWIRPGVCRARLNRPDVQPEFVATTASATG